MLRRFKFGLLSLATAGLLTLGLSQPAHATLRVGINGAEPVAADPTNTGIDLNGVTVGAFKFGTGSGVSGANSPIFGGNAGIDLGALTVTSSGAGTLSILVSENFLTVPSGPGTLSQTLSGHLIFGTLATFTLMSWLDNTNSSSVTTPTGIVTPTVTGPPGGSSSVAIPAAIAPYGLFQLLTITFSAAGGVMVSTSTDSTTQFTAVPEPSTMAIASLGALGMIGYGLRRRKAMGA